MAHKKAGGTKARQGGNVAGKRLGVKVSGGALVKAGQIIVRQRGRTFIPGENTGMGKDYTIFSTTKGTVNFVNDTRTKKRIDVTPLSG
jgi:large subunit ribosomal protein L27